MKAFPRGGARWLLARSWGFTWAPEHKDIFKPAARRQRWKDNALLALAVMCWVAAGVWAICTGRKFNFPG